MPNSQALENDLLKVILEKVANWAQARSEILALALVGSHARGEAKPESDIDLMFVTSDTEFFRQDCDWLHEISWENINYKILKWNDAQYGVVWSRHVYLANLTNEFNKELKIEFSFGLPSWASINPIGLTQTTYLVVGCCDTLTNFQRSNNVFSVTHHLSVVTIA
ncbi:MAG: nucleotidyltransferase domain-containing protein [Rivularia sp. (in: Bacteria)]|nr:nucleotidyltransferase domain-containing protein [Rivularia sp. MS3]